MCVETPQFLNCFNSSHKRALFNSLCIGVYSKIQHLTSLLIIQKAKKCGEKKNKAREGRREPDKRGWGREGKKKRKLRNYKKRKRRRVKT